MLPSWLSGKELTCQFRIYTGIGRVVPQKLSTQKLGTRKCRSGRLERGTSSLQWKHPPDWALQERDSASADTSYVINYLKVASGTFLTPVMQLISPKETQLEASGVSEGAKQKSTFRA